jgi:RNA polymerase sigma-70 factor, ECF subfamily
MHEGNGDRSQASDEALMAAVTRREVAAAAALHRRYAPPAYAFAAHVLGPAEAEDVVQEAFLRVWRKAGQFDQEKGPFHGWFFAIVRNLVQDALKRRSRRERLALADGVDLLLEEAPDPSADVEEHVWRRERAVALLQALKSLPAEQRRVLVLAYFGTGLSQSSIAEHLGWPLGTVKKRTSLALHKLRALLDQHSLTAGVVGDPALDEGAVSDGM